MVLRRQRKSDARGSVRGVVIDDDHLPWQTVENDFDAFEKELGY